jgi:L-threonylcarbamoyladenylate synthase
MAVSAGAAAELARVVAADGVVLFPADTVYGLGCDPASRRAVERLYALKGRAADRPAAVMFFTPDGLALALPELGERTRAALAALMPGPVTAVVPNPERRFPLAAGPHPERLGVRVPALPPPLAALGEVAAPLLQSSANPSGELDARRLEDVHQPIRAGVDLELDGGELPGTPSTVVDLTEFESTGGWSLLRAGALPAEAVERALQV